jgi:hypothetical protein
VTLSPALSLARTHILSVRLSSSLSLSLSLSFAHIIAGRVFSQRRVQGERHLLMVYGLGSKVSVVEPRGSIFRFSFVLGFGIKIAGSGCRVESWGLDPRVADGCTEKNARTALNRFPES